MAALPYRHGLPQSSARFKEQLEDFKVTEVLGYGPPVGQQQEHLWLELQKQGQNTTWVAGQLARHFRRPNADVSYAGLKDRQGITQQWFSVRLGAVELVAELSIPGVKLISHQAAAKKLQRGALQGNRFEIRLRDVDNPNLLQERFDRLCADGVPNYFGSQRFGHGAANLLLAERWRQGQYRPRNRAEKGFLISALRAWLFNLQAANAVGKNSADDGFLLGAMRFDPPAELATLLTQYQAQSDWLVKQGCKMQKRPLQLALEAPQLLWQGSDALLRFGLPAGSYATAVLRELVTI